MDYVEQAKTANQVGSFTYFEYLKLKRKPPKVETKPETNRTHRADFKADALNLTYTIQPTHA